MRKHSIDVSAVKKREFQKDVYWGKPVPDFGESKPELLIVGLAPSAHGGNRTGRMFTGDRSGQWLFRALHKFGFANQSTYLSADDGLTLIETRITTVCHCAPPNNKPLPAEIENCRDFLRANVCVSEPKAILCLGSIAWQQVLCLLSQRSTKFAHGARLSVSPVGPEVFASYHPSQQNTFTKVLTEPMFDAVFENIREFLNGK